MPKFWQHSWHHEFGSECRFPSTYQISCNSNTLTPMAPYWHPPLILHCNFLHPCYSRKECVVCSTSIKKNTLKKKNGTQFIHLGLITNIILQQCQMNMLPMNIENSFFFWQGEKRKFSNLGRFDSNSKEELRIHEG